MQDAGQFFPFRTHPYPSCPHHGVKQRPLTHFQKPHHRWNISRDQGCSVNNWFNWEQNHDHVVYRSGHPRETDFNPTPADTNAEEIWTLPLRPFALSPSATMHPPQATDKTLWMNEQVIFLICCNKQCRCCLERGQWDQVTRSVNKKGNMSFDAQFKTVKSHSWGTELRFKGILTAAAAVVTSLLLGSSDFLVFEEPMLVLLAYWKEVPRTCPLQFLPKGWAAMNKNGKTL